MNLPDCPPLYYCTWTQKPPDPPTFQWDPIILFIILGVAFVAGCLAIAAVEVFDRRVRIADLNARRAQDERVAAEYKASVSGPRRGPGGRYQG